MLYKDLISLDPNFEPAFDLTNEKEDQWKRFIPTESFNNLLKSLLDSLHGPTHFSIWLQGTYGTGKSHATSVIKHLLSDPWDSVQDFCSRLENPLSIRIRNYRQANRIIPVVMKGASTIYDVRTFNWEIQKQVKMALPQVRTESDFETMINRIERPGTLHIDWDQTIRQTPELRRYVSNKDELLNKLRAMDKTILTELQKFLVKHGFDVMTDDLSKWIKQVMAEVTERGLGSALVIFWDEFTSLLDTCPSTVITELQSLAELSREGTFYLYLITHRKPAQTSISEDDVQKVLDRFKVVDYKMEPLTTYQLISATLRSEDSESLERVRQQETERIKGAIGLIIKNGSTNERSTVSETVLKQMFPIHPYTAYLLTFISRNLGSTNRSVFSFLFDEELGFKKFIQENPGDQGEIFLSADALWDFFYAEFENSDDDRVIASVDRYKSHFEPVRSQGADYLKVFKLVLLLNVLMKYTDVNEVPLVAPSKSNVVAAFEGSLAESKVLEVLRYLDEAHVITSDGDLYIVTSSVIPPVEVEIAKRELRWKLEDAAQIFREPLFGSLGEDLLKTLTTPTLRPAQGIILDADTQGAKLLGDVVAKFKNPWELHVAAIIARNASHLASIKAKLQEISLDPLLSNVVFVVIESVLEENVRERLLDYLARELVAKKHSYAKEAELYAQKAKQTLREWVNRAKEGWAYVILRNRSERQLVGNVGLYLVSEAAPLIFSKSLDSLRRCWNENIWKKQNSKASVELFLFPETREDWLQQTSKGLQSFLRYILVDDNNEYIVNARMNLADSRELSHPILEAAALVDQAMETAAREGTFNLGNALEQLRRPPYGYYQSQIFMAAMGYLMRKYVGKLHQVTTGSVVTKEKMRDIVVSLFNYWQSGGPPPTNLIVKFGSPEEERLKEFLIDLFDLHLEAQDVSLSDVRREIRVKLKRDLGIPLWMLEVAADSAKVKEAILELSKLVSNVEEEITQSDVAKCLEILEQVHEELKPVLKDVQWEDLFSKWVRAKVADDLDATALQLNVQDIMDYIRKHLAEELFQWKENEIADLVRTFLSRQAVRARIASVISTLVSTKVTDLDFSLRNLKDFVGARGYPLWVYCTVLDEEGRRAISVLQELLKALEVNQLDDLPLENYEEVLLQSREALLNVFNADSECELFKEWLIKHIRIPSPTGNRCLEGLIHDIVTHLRNQLGSNVLTWSENEVIEEAYQFVIKNCVTPPPPPPNLIKLIDEMPEERTNLLLQRLVTLDLVSAKQILKILLQNPDTKKQVVTALSETPEYKEKLSNYIVD